MSDALQLARQQHVCSSIHSWASETETRTALCPFWKWTAWKDFAAFCQLQWWPCFVNFHYAQLQTLSTNVNWQDKHKILLTVSASKDSRSCGDWILCTSSRTAVWGPSRSLLTLLQKATIASQSTSLFNMFVARSVICHQYIFVCHYH